ncbi:MAG: NRDE family protein [Verrucomicrobiota bacterium]
MLQTSRYLSGGRLTMCTVTFMARKRGYALGMNRDEKLTRPSGLPPKKRMVNGHAIISPSEPGGGTWIAVNDCGATFALINWYSVTARVVSNAVSRGEVVNSVCAAISPGIADASLRGLPLHWINPFRLIGVFPTTSEIVEWRWNLKKLVQKNHRWKTQQWISSGFDEPAAQRVRSRTFQQALQQRSAGRIDWLRRLHRSHSPQSGPFSTCMHRADAETVSYTEITILPSVATLRYHAVTPCMRIDAANVTLALNS